MGYEVQKVLQMEIVLCRNWSWDVWRGICEGNWIMVFSVFGVVVESFVKQNRRKCYEFLILQPPSCKLRHDFNNHK